MNNEEAFLSSTFREFIKCWRSGTKARVIIESVNGHAFVNFSAFLGYPDDVHVKPRPSKRKPSGGPRKKSAKKTQRDNDRAARYQEQKRREGAASASNNPEEAVVTSSPGAASASNSTEEAVVTSSPGAESAMTLSGLEFSFASPVPETLRQTSINEISTSMILSDVNEQTEQNEQETDSKGEDQNVSDDDGKCSKAAQKCQEDAPDEQTCEIHTKEMLERGRKQMISNIERFEHIPWWREDKLNYEFMKEKENEIARCRKCQIQKVRSEVRSLKSILWTDPSQFQKRIVTLGENLNSEK